jgi:peptidoglycan hydrolase-like protein with peptidoglycan-binding domain
MRGYRVHVVVVALVLAASCGGDGGSLPPATDPPDPHSVSTTTEPVSPDTTPAPSVVTTVEPAAVEEAAEKEEEEEEEEEEAAAVLRPDGLGPVDFGVPAEETVEQLTGLLGSPTGDVSIGPDGECVEGAVWLDCVKGLRVIEQGRLLTWAEFGLEVALVDSDPTGTDAGRVPLQLGDWHATATSGSARLQTAEGIFPGITIGELKLLAPGLEFGYGEGLLDGVFVIAPTGGGYWGRLDWDPDTTPVENVDIRAVQAALTAHGATLDVDGVWGPDTETAWLEFLADHGIEPATPQLWLTPEVGDALGLPPDDITVATIQPRPTHDSSSPSTLGLTLRADGIGRFNFGEPADELHEEFISMLGSPIDTVEFSAPPPDRLYVPGGYQALHELVQYEWAEPSLLVVLGDTPYLGDQWAAPVPGTLHLLTWETRSADFTFENGFGVGSTLGEMRSTHPDVTVGGWDICETEYHPDLLAVPASVFGLRGRLDWDWVRDLQLALNDRGADLEADGIYGPDTTTAVRSFQQAEGIEETGSAEGPDGRIGPRTISALDLAAPQSAPIRDLEAGYPGSC